MKAAWVDLTNPGLVSCYSPSACDLLLKDSSETTNISSLHFPSKVYVGGTGAALSCVLFQVGRPADESATYLKTVYCSGMHYPLCYSDCGGIKGLFLKWLSPTILLIMHVILPVHSSNICIVHSAGLGHHGARRQQVLPRSHDSNSGTCVFFPANIFILIYYSPNFFTLMLYLITVHRCQRLLHRPGRGPLRPGVGGDAGGLQQRRGVQS